MMSSSPEDITACRRKIGGEHGFQRCHLLTSAAFGKSLRIYLAQPCPAVMVFTYIFEEDEQVILDDLLMTAKAAPEAYILPLHQRTSLSL